MVIFDLDLTLVDSRRVLELQRRRRWRSVFSMVPEIEPYDGIPELLARLHGARVPVAIVTSSPDQYCRRIVEYRGWNVGTVIGFHDVRHRKPHPEPIDLALQRMGVPSAGAVSAGDRADDTAAARAASVFSIGAAWGSLEPEALEESTPDLMCHSVAELTGYLTRRFGLRDTPDGVLRASSG